MRRWKMGLLIISVLLTTGCSKREKEHVQSVEEVVTEPEYTTEQPTTIDTSNAEIFNAEYVTYFIDDSHFYDEKEMTYTSTLQNSEGTRIKVLNAFASDELTAGGAYFSQVQEDVNRSINVRLKASGGVEVDYTYVFVEVEIKNISDTGYRFCAVELRLVTRVPDDSMVQYGLADHRVAGEAGECYWDYEERDYEDKNYYMKDLEPGESIHAVLCYLTPEEDVSEELYLKLAEQEQYGICDYITGQWRPNDSEDLKFMRIHLN